MLCESNCYVPFTSSGGIRTKTGKKLDRNNIEIRKINLWNNKRKKHLKSNAIFFSRKKRISRETHENNILNNDYSKSPSNNETLPLEEQKRTIDIVNSQSWKYPSSSENDSNVNSSLFHTDNLRKRQVNDENKEYKLHGDINQNNDSTHKFGEEAKTTMRIFQKNILEAPGAASYKTLPLEKQKRIINIINSRFWKYPSTTKNDSDVSSSHSHNGDLIERDSFLDGKLNQKYKENRDINQYFGIKDRLKKTVGAKFSNDMVIQDIPESTSNSKTLPLEEQKRVIDITNSQFWKYPSGALNDSFNSRLSRRQDSKRRYLLESGRLNHKNKLNNIYQNFDAKDGFDTRSKKAEVNFPTLKMSGSEQVNVINSNTWIVYNTPSVNNGAVLRKKFRNTQIILKNNKNPSDATNMLLMGDIGSIIQKLINLNSSESQTKDPETAFTKPQETYQMDETFGKQFSKHDEQNENENNFREFDQISNKPQVSFASISDRNKPHQIRYGIKEINRPIDNFNAYSSLTSNLPDSKQSFVQEELDKKFDSKNEYDKTYQNENALNNKLPKDYNIKNVFGIPNEKESILNNEGLKNLDLKNMFGKPDEKKNYVKSEEIKNLDPKNKLANPEQNENILFNEGLKNSYPKNIFAKPNLYENILNNVGQRNLDPKNQYEKLYLDENIRNNVPSTDKHLVTDDYRSAQEQPKSLDDLLLTQNRGNSDVFEEDTSKKPTFTNILTNISPNNGVINLVHKGGISPDKLNRDLYLNEKDIAVTNVNKFENNFSPKPYQFKNLIDNVLHSTNTDLITEAVEISDQNKLDAINNEKNEAELGENYEKNYGLHNANTSIIKEEINSPNPSKLIKDFMKNRQNESLIDFVLYSTDANSVKKETISPYRSKPLDKKKVPFSKQQETKFLTEFGTQNKENQEDSIRDYDYDSSSNLRLEKSQKIINRKGGKTRPVTNPSAVITNNISSKLSLSLSNELKKAIKISRNGNDRIKPVIIIAKNTAREDDDRPTELHTLYPPWEKNKLDYNAKNTALFPVEKSIKQENDENRLEMRFRSPHRSKKPEIHYKKHQLPGDFVGYVRSKKHIDVSNSLGAKDSSRIHSERKKREVKSDVPPKIQFLSTNEKKKILANIPLDNCCYNGGTCIRSPKPDGKCFTHIYQQ
ncbi:homeobox protein 2-like [Parasteatoda tepidariorum]|uniref:homeobox protein 2-like n=1 Tax=Parasteatoda tepidariorum TaxID=114398 RepID=UPI0039BC3449